MKAPNAVLAHSPAHLSVKERIIFPADAQKGYLAVDGNRVHHSDDWDPFTAFDLKKKGFLGFIIAAILLCIPYQQRRKSSAILISYS